MVCVRVPLLLKRNIGVLFGVLSGPRSDAPPFFFIYFFIIYLLWILYRCDIYLFPLRCVMKQC
jgi:hypothetical protein